MHRDRIADRTGKHSEKGKKKRKKKGSQVMAKGKKRKGEAKNQLSR